MKTRQDLLDYAAAHDLPIYWGTGYPIAKPHIVAVKEYRGIYVAVYPKGDNACGGLGLDPSDPLFRPHTSFFVSH